MTVDVILGALKKAFDFLDEFITVKFDYTAEILFLISVASVLKIFESYFFSILLAILVV